MTATPAMTPKDLPERFHDYIAKSVGPEGWPVAPGWILNKQSELTILAMDLHPEQIYRTMLAQATQLDAAAFIFAIDRFTKPGQGTVRTDVLSGHACIGDLSNMRPFIIEYDPVLGIVDPINFDNAFWCGALSSELMAITRRTVGRVSTH